jgi:hypothetical protein
LARPSNLPVQLDTMAFVSLGGSDEVPRLHHAARRRGGVAARTDERSRWRNSMPSTASPTDFDPLHLYHIDLVDGQFCPGGTTADDLTRAFNNFQTSNKLNNHLCVFFHGGLVSRSEGLDTASRLIGDYTNECAYPFFFIWNSGLLDALNSGLLDALKREMQPYDNPLFAFIVNYTFRIVARKIKAALDNKRLRLPARGRSLKQLATLARAYDQAWGKRAGAQLGCSQRELDQFARFIANAEKAPVRHRMFKRTRAPKNPIARIIARILYRLNTGHDHGVYTTIIEELFIAAGLAAVVRNRIWLQLVKSIDRSFESGSTAGGTAFVDHLCNSWTNNPTLRVTLIGHSMGAIYVQRMIEALNARLPEGSTAQLEVILLAAAISFARMNLTLSVLRKRVSGLRVFALNSMAECYPEIPPYDKSLLYIVSSLCENDQNADKPLVGMKHYWDGYWCGTPPYIRDPDIHAVINLIGKREVWAPTKPNAPPGWRSRTFVFGSRHGKFPKEPCTRASVREILKNGFRPY